MGAEIKWVRGAEERNSVLTQAEELNHICEIIESRSDEHVERVTLIGSLVAWHTVRRTFTFSVPDAELIPGKMHKDFDASETRLIPAMYEALIAKHTRVIYTQEEDESWWELESLQSL